MSSLESDFLICPSAPELPEGEKAPLALPPPRPHFLRWVLWTVVVLAVAFLGWFGFILARLGMAAYGLKNSVAAVRTDLVAGSFGQASKDLDAVGTSLDDAAKSLAVFHGLREAPFVGRDIRAMEGLVDVARHVQDGGSAIIRAAASFEDVLEATHLVRSSLDTGVEPTRRFQDLPPQEKRVILTRLDGLLPQLRLAREKMAIAAEVWSNMSAGDLSAPFLTNIRALGDQLPILERQTDEAISFLELLLPLVGYPNENKFLVLLQNADEMRPTGGFIGTVGYFKIDAADVKDLQFNDVYSLDDPVKDKWKDPVPEPMKRWLGVKAWYLRDRNWSPDFPQSAEDIMQTYARERAMAASSTIEEVNGVIAFEPAFFEDLLRFTGSLTVGTRTFTAENFFDQLQYDTEIGFAQKGIPVAKRKEIVLQLGDALVARLMSLPARQWPQLLDLLAKGFQEKNILISVRDAQTQALLDAHGWTGRTRTAAGDYLWVVDANLGAFKTDGVMEKNISYSLDTRGNGAPIATVKLTYHNTNSIPNWRYIQYRDYVRIYVPDGSTFMGLTGATSLAPVTVTHELGKTAFGIPWTVDPGATATLTIQYRLPEAIGTQILQNSYQLLVQKQPGSNTQLTIDHAFGKNLTYAAPSEAAKEIGDAFYRVSLPMTVDRLFQIRF
jgi:hypothetical protein